MRILNELEMCKKNTAVALGFFDGVHLGHKAVISEAVKCASLSGLTSAVCTFEQSPSAVLSGTLKSVITDNNKKCEYISKLGAELLYMLPFEQVMNLSCEDFIHEILYKTFNARHIFCGFNYHFGKGGVGDIKVLSEICKKYNISVTEIPPVLYNGEAISSTRIRNSLIKGDIINVNNMLGHKFELDFEVVSGNRLGRKLGFPTLNQALPENFIKPLYGVYASAFLYGGTAYASVTNIGIKPTVGGNIPLAETWVIGKNVGDFYNKKARIVLLDFIRHEKKFDSIEQLKNTVLDNGKTAQMIFEQHYSANTK